MKKNKKLSKFELFVDFIEKAGAEVLSPTNEYEVLRFKANCRIGVVYKNSVGKITSYTGEAKEAWDAFNANNKWSATKVNERIRKHIVLRTLLARDGSYCFYCGKEMNDGDETIEHLFSINQGGNNHVANLVLAHFECNKAAASLPIVKKVELRDKMRNEIPAII